MARRGAQQAEEPLRADKRRSAGRAVAVFGWPNLALYLFFGAALSISVVSRISESWAAFPAAIQDFYAVVLEPSSADAKLSRFFADDYRGIRFLDDSPLTASDPHILAAGPMYRFLKKGIYSLSPMSWDFLQPGDLYFSARPNTPSDGWTMLRDAPSSLMIYEPGAIAPKPESMLLMGAHAPKLLRSSEAGLETEFTGEGSLLAIDVLKDVGQHRGAVVTFRFMVESPGVEPAIVTGIVPYSWDVIDKEHTFKCMRPLDGGAPGRYACSGMVTFRDVPLSARLTVDGVYVGFGSDTEGVRAVLKNYTYRVYTGIGSLQLRP
jgi:hypothetical protein